jgi:hypothetical protein
MVVLHLRLGLFPDSWRMPRHLMPRVSVAATAALMLSACAPIESLYSSWMPGRAAPVSSNDPCQRPDVVGGITRSLNEKIGKPDGPAAYVVSASGLTAVGSAGALDCHGVLETMAGPNESGTVRVTGEERRDFHGVTTGYNIIDASWEPDAGRDRKEALTRRTRDPQAPVR